MKKHRTKKLTTKEFISKSKGVHGLTYKYTSSIYEGSKIPISILCRKHGAFFQRPNDHLMGHGCARCATDEAKLNLSLSTASFIKKAKVKHKDKFDYSKVVYKNVHQKVEIICSSHGSFFQKANDHLSGHGCRKCGMTLGRKTKKKQYQLSEATVLVQGYEPQALNYLIDTLGVLDSKIRVGLDVPVIEYTERGKQHLHFPDIFIPEKNTLVEVKSTYTFLTNLSTLKRKRRGAIKAGFKYSVFVMESSGNKILLPKGWHLRSYSSMSKMLMRNKT